jgi:hypothetical protein
MKKIINRINKITLRDVIIFLFFTVLSINVAFSVVRLINMLHKIPITDSWVEIIFKIAPCVFILYFSINSKTIKTNSNEND